MTELQSPIDLMVNRNLDLSSNTEQVQTHQNNQSLIDALASAGSKGEDTTQTDDFSWARETTKHSQSSDFDLDDLKSKGVDEKTLAFLRDSQKQEVKTPPKEIDKQQTQPKLIIPNLDPNKVVENLDFSDLYDVKDYVKKIGEKLKVNPLEVPLHEDITASLSEAGLDYIPGLIQHFSQQAVIKAVELAMSEMTGILPKALGKFSTGLSTGLGDSSYQAQVLANFNNELEVMIAKTYIPKYKEAFPNADPSEAAKAIREYIDTKGGTVKKEEDNQAKETKGNPWFSL